MGTNYIAPIWRMPRNFNKDNLSNYSIKFGTNEVINFDSYTLPDKYTISIWLNPDASYGTDYGYYIGGSPTAGHGFAIGQGGAAFDIGELYFFFGGSTSTGTGVILNQNEWSHVLLVVDKTFGSQGKIETYLNNNLESTITSFTATPVSSFTSISIIGANKSDASQWDFSGEISQCCVFDYALSTDQINYLYNLNNPMTITGAEPIAYWPLGDNSNPNAPGSFPNISVGADSVFDFDGTNYINTNFQIGTETAYSFSAWFKMASAPANYSTILADANSSGQSKSQRAQLGFYQNFFFAIMGNGSSSWYDLSSYNISAAYDNNWHNITLVINGTSQQLYLDGSLVQTYTSSISAGTAGTQNYTIGRYGDYNGHYFDGELSNVQIWDTDLQLPDVVELYNNGQPLMTGTQPQEANLQAWYKLNQTETWDEGVAPFSVEKVGSPDYTNSGDGCFTTSGVLRWQDTGDQLLSSGNYFTYLSPVIYASAQDVDLITTGGSYQTGIVYGLEYSLEYSVDGGSWIVWKTDIISNNTPLTNWTVANVNNLNVNRSIQIRLRAVAGNSGSEQFNFNDIRINVNGHNSYEETFGTASKGWLNGAYDPPTDYWKTPEWIISDASAPYQKSMNINAVGSTYISDRFNSYEGPRGMNTNVGTYSCWVNLDTLGSQVFMDVPGYAAREFLNFRIRSNGALQMEMRSWSTQMLWDTVSTTPLTAGKWHHIVAVGDGSNVVFYIDGQLEPSYIASGSYRWWSNFNASLSYPNVGNKIYLGSGTYPTRHSPMNGRISNAQIWNTNLNGAQILDLYNNGKPLQGTQPAAENLLAWYKLDENDSSWINYNYNNNVLVNKWNVKNSATPTPTSTEALNLSGTSQDGTKESFEISNTSVNGSITLSVWYKATGSGIKIFDFESSGSIPYASVRFSSDDIYIYSNDNSSRAEGAGRINLGYSWTNVIIHIPNTSPTFDATQIRWWQNGVEEPTLSVIGSTTWNAFQEVRGLNVGSTSTTYAGAGYQFSNWAWFEDLTINDANIETIYNSGTPGDLSTLNPKAWYKLDSTDITFGSSGPKASALSITDSSSNGNNATGPYDYDLPNTITSRPTIAPGDVQESIVGNNMTEGQLQRPAVSVLNGESENMNSTNLVQSNLTRTQPYSNYSFNFDSGNSEVIDITNNSIFNLGSSFSISGWFNLDYSNSTRGFISFDSSTTRGWFFYTLSGNEIRIFDGTNAFVLKTSYTTTGQWDNFIVTYDGSNLVFYINGVQESTQAVSVDLQTNGNNGQIGNNQFASGRFFDGKMSNIALLDRALTEQEVLKIYNNGVPQDLQTTSTFSNNIVAWWAMDERSSYYDGTDWVVRDLINGNDGGGINTGGVEDLVGDAPGSEVSGTGANLTIADLKGDMYNSKNNAYSINMADYADGVTNPANSGRSTEVPSV